MKPLAVKFDIGTIIPLNNRSGILFSDLPDFAKSWSIPFIESKDE
jgi:hypothetical protein